MNQVVTKNNDEFDLDYVIKDTLRALDHVEPYTGATDPEGFKYTKNLLQKLRQQCAGILKKPFGKDDMDSIAEPFGDFMEEVQSISQEIGDGTEPPSEIELVKRIPVERIRRLVDTLRERVEEASKKYMSKNTSN